MRLRLMMFLTLMVLMIGLIGCTTDPKDDEDPDNGIQDPNGNGTPNGDDPVPSVHRPENVDLSSGDLSGWTIASGNAFDDAFVSDAQVDTSGRPIERDSAFYFGHGDEARTGVLESAPFVIGGTGIMTFRLGGGSMVPLTYLSVVRASDQIELYRFANASQESTESVLIAYQADLSASLGTEVFLRVVDDAVANGGMILFADIEPYHPELPHLDSYISAENIAPDFEDTALAPYQLENGDFATRTLAGWTVHGETGVFQDSHINANGRLSNRPNETAVGLLRSGAFTVGGQNLMSFRLGATKHPELTYMVVRRVGTNEEVFRTWSDRWQDIHEEATHLYYIDLRAYEGEQLYLEFVDNARGDWGLLTLEQVRTHYTERPLVTDEIAVNLHAPYLSDPQYTVMRSYVDPLIAQIEDETERLTFEKTFYSTLDGFSNRIGNFPSVTEYRRNGNTFIITGDIPAMWLRDSAAQVLNYLQFMTVDEEVRLMVRGLLTQQFEQIRRDPYANAFNADGSVWERKFEIDSLCYPIWLADEYYHITGDASLFDAFFEMTVARILDTFEAEQNHDDANYRMESEYDRQFGTHEVNTDTNLIWSAYRPSDSPTYYKFYIPGNMFAVATLERIDALMTELGLDPVLAERARIMAAEVRADIEQYGVYHHPEFGRMYAFEVNGFNDDPHSPTGKRFRDIANIPNLLSAPWLGYVPQDDPTYQNTRAFVLSSHNPYFHEGTYARGIGDPHDIVWRTRPHDDYPVPWHLGLVMQAMTTDDPDEIRLMVDYMVNTTAGTYVMHEGFYANNPNIYSRDWFTWPNALFAHVYLTEIIGFNLLED
ncbi:MAG: glycoside hydrolase family 125 protein [Acholeplasmatales bacterium]|nr:MAG: glycoside hydrolase family 125 protein [Acholeplasmatales bacterium]